MTTPSSATHESPREVSIAPSAGHGSRSPSEREGAGWSGRFRRARQILLGEAAVGSAPPDAQAASSTSCMDNANAVVALLPASQREDDRTTRIYQRSAIDSAANGLSTEGGGPREEVSTTMRLPSSQLDALLLQIHEEVGSRQGGPSDSASPPEVEVSSITYDELERFRRSLVDPLTLPREGVSEQAALLSAALKTVPKGAAPETLRARARKVAARLFRRASPILVRGLFRVMDVGMVCQTRLSALRARYLRRALPVASDAAAGTQNPSDTSASQPN